MSSANELCGQRAVEMWAGEVRGSGHGVLASQLQYVYTAAYAPSIHTCTRSIQQLARPMRKHTARGKKSGFPIDYQKKNDKILV